MIFLYYTFRMLFYMVTFFDLLNSIEFFSHLQLRPDLRLQSTFDYVWVIPFYVKQNVRMIENVFFLYKCYLNSSGIKYAKSGRACRTDDMSGGIVRSFSSYWFDPLINKSSSVSCCIYRSIFSFVESYQYVSYAVRCCLGVPIKVQVIFRWYTCICVYSCCIH